MTKEEIRPILARLLLIFDQTQQAQAKIALFEEYLEGLRPDILSEAVDECIYACTFFPTIAEIMKFYDPLEEAARLREKHGVVLRRIELPNQTALTAGPTPAGKAEARKLITHLSKNLSMPNPERRSDAPPR